MLRFRDRPVISPRHLGRAALLLFLSQNPPGAIAFNAGAPPGSSQPAGRAQDSISTLRMWHKVRRWMRRSGISAEPRREGRIGNVRSWLELSPLLMGGRQRLETSARETLDILRQPFEAKVLDRLYHTTSEKLPRVPILDPREPSRAKDQIFSLARQMRPDQLRPLQDALLADLRAELKQRAHEPQAVDLSQAAAIAQATHDILGLGTSETPGRSGNAAFLRGVSQYAVDEMRYLLGKSAWVDQLDQVLAGGEEGRWVDSSERVTSKFVELAESLVVEARKLAEPVERKQPSGPGGGDSSQPENGDKEALGRFNSALGEFRARWRASDTVRERPLSLLLCAYAELWRPEIQAILGFLRRTDQPDRAVAAELEGVMNDTDQWLGLSKVPGSLPAVRTPRPALFAPVLGTLTTEREQLRREREQLD